MEIPNTVTHKLSNAERFIIGLNQISLECGLKSIAYNKLGVVEYFFEDGSSVGCVRAHKEAGLITGF